MVTCFSVRKQERARKGRKSRTLLPVLANSSLRFIFACCCTPERLQLKWPAWSCTCVLFTNVSTKQAWIQGARWVPTNRTPIRICIPMRTVPSSHTSSSMKYAAIDSNSRTRSSLQPFVFAQRCEYTRWHDTRFERLLARDGQPKTCARTSYFRHEASYDAEVPPGRDSSLLFISSSVLLKSASCLPSGTRGVSRKDAALQNAHPARARTARIRSDAPLRSAQVSLKCYLCPGRLVRSLSPQPDPMDPSLLPQALSAAYRALWKRLCGHHVCAPFPTVELTGQSALIGRSLPWMCPWLRWASPRSGLAQVLSWKP